MLETLGGGSDLIKLRDVALSTGFDAHELLQWLDTVLLAGLRALAGQPVGYELEYAVEDAFQAQMLPGAKAS